MRALLRAFASLEQRGSWGIFKRGGAAETELYANVIAGVVRVAVRVPYHKHRGRLYGAYPWSVALGINDLGGIIYWATR